MKDKGDRNCANRMNWKRREGTAAHSRRSDVKTVDY